MRIWGSHTPPKGMVQGGHATSRHADGVVECLGPGVCGRVVQHVYMRVVCAYSHICWVRGCARRACRYSDGWAWCCARSTFDTPNTNTVYSVHRVRCTRIRYTVY